MTYNGPKEIIVGVNKVKVVPYNFTKKDSHKFADFDSWTYEVRVSNDKMSHEVMRQTILHELLHSIEYGNFPIKKLTEVQIEQLSAGLYSIIRDNKEFIRWLQQGEK